MKLTLNKLDAPFLMEVKNSEENSVLLDANESIGGTGKGLRPMELVAAGLAGCSSIDVLNILRKKKKTIDSLRVEIDATRVDDIPAVFDTIQLIFHLQTDASETDLEQALRLTFEKYCSVSKMLEKTVKITYSYKLNA